MIYDSLAQPPQPGSMLEFVCTLVRMRREMAKLMEVRLIVQALKDESDDGDVTQRAYEDYRRALMPYIVIEERERVQVVKDAIAREAALGPMRIKPIAPTGNLASKLSSAVRSAREEPKPKIRWRRRRR